MTSTEDAQYLKACLALGIDPNTREKVSNGSKNGNGSSAGVKLPKEQRAHSGESMEGISRRLERERAEEVRQARLEFHDRMYQTHIGIAREHAEAYDKLSIAEGGSGG